jgi:hypothetical protein
VALKRPPKEDIGEGRQGRLMRFGLRKRFKKKQKDSSGHNNDSGDFSARSESVKNDIQGKIEYAVKLLYFDGRSVLPDNRA